MQEKQYKAFISYSHKDEKFGKWLHKALEGYKIPKELYQDNPNLPKKLFPIFRDRDELSTSADLGTEILKALRNSEYLIIICSVNSAKSIYVNQEIIDFKAIHGEKNIHAIIIDGEPHAKENDKFDDDLECFPEALKYKVIDGKLSDIPTEPIAGDFRKGKDGKEHGKLKLISGLLGVGFDELNRREEKRKRRNRFVWGIISVSLIVVMVGLTLFSLLQRDMAIKNKQKMQKELYANTIQKGVQERDSFSNPLKSKLLFAKSVSISTNKVEERNSKILYNSMNKIKLNNIYKHNSSKYGCWGADFSKNEKQILSWSGNIIKLWDSDSDRVISSFKHDNIVQGAIFNRNNTKILSWSDDKTVRLWDIKKNKQYMILKTPYIVYRARFTKNEKKIICWGNNKSVDKSFIYLWDIMNQKIFFHKKMKIPLNGAILNSHEDKILCWGGRSYLNEIGFVKIFHATSKKMLLSLKFKNNVHGVSYSKDKKKLLIWTAYSIKIWDLSKRKYLFNTQGDDWVLKAEFNNDENEILVRYGHHGNNWKRNVKLWSILNNKKPLFVWSHDSSFINGAVFNKDYTEVLTWGDDGKVKIWSTKYGILLKEIKHTKRVAGAKFFDSDKKILCWTGVNTNIENNNKGSIYLWKSDYSEKKPFFILEHDGIINNIKISKDKKKLLSYGSDNLVKLWDISSESLIKNISYNFNIKINSLSSKGDKLLLWDGKNKIKVIDIKKNKTIINKYLKNNCQSVFFSPLENKIVTYNKHGKINIITTDNEQLKSYKHRNEIGSIVFNKDETLMMVNYGDYYYYNQNLRRELIVWDVESRKKILYIKLGSDLTNMRFLNDNKILITTQKGLLKIIDLKAKQFLLELNFNNKIEKIELDEKEEKILIQLGSSNIIVYDLKNKRELFNKKDNVSVINGISFSKNFKNIFSWNQDGSIKLWNIEKQKLLRTFKHKISIKNIVLSKKPNIFYSWSGSTTNIPSSTSSIRIWNSKKNLPLLIFGKNIGIETGIEKVLINMDETNLYSWAGFLFHIWNIEDGIKLLEVNSDELDMNLQVLGNSQLAILKNKKLMILNLLRARKLPKKYYTLEAQVELGVYLTSSGEIETLSIKEWKEKKAQYEKILIKTKMETP